MPDTAAPTTTPTTGTTPPAAPEPKTGTPPPAQPATGTPPPSIEGKKPEVAPAGPPKIMAKVDGKEVEVNVAETFPEFAEAWEKLTETQKKRILAMHQKDLSASHRFEQANLTRKQMAGLISALAEDPMSVLTHPKLNLNVRKVVEEWLSNQIEYEAMDPKEKERVDALKRVKEYERKEVESKKEKERNEIAALTENYNKSYQTEIIAAIESSGLPKSSETVARIAYYLRQALEDRDGKPGVRLRAIDVVPLVREDYEKAFKRLIGEADPESLVKILGDEFSEKFRKHLLKPLKTTGKTPEEQPPASNDKPKKTHLTKDEWREAIRQRVG